MGKPKPVIFQGTEYPSLKQLAENFGVEPMKLRRRVASGWPMEEALEISQRAPAQGAAQPVSFNGVEYRSRQKLAAAFGIKPAQLNERLAAGWSMGQALGLVPRDAAKNAPKPITFRGKLYQSKQALARAFNIDKYKLSKRLKWGWSVEEALGLQPRPKGGNALKVAGQSFASLAAAARHYNLRRAKVENRLKSGWSVDQAFELEPAPRKNPSRGAGHKIRYLGQSFDSKKAVGESYGLDWSVISRRLKRGWTERQAVNLDPPPPRFAGPDGKPRKSKYADPVEIDGKIFAHGTVGEFKLYGVRNKKNGKMYIGVTCGSLR